MVKKQQGFSAIFLILLLILLILIGGIGVYVWQNQNKSATPTPTPVASTSPTPTPLVLVAGDFSDKGGGNYYGMFQARGYTTVQKVDEAWCEIDCAEYDYVFFNITSTPNANVDTYINSIGGNSFVGSKKIGIGCLVDGQISYSNDSDANGMQEITVSSEDTTAIMAATEADSIALQIERLKYTSGRGAPTCYSHFTTITVL